MWVDSVFGLDAVHDLVAGQVDHVDDGVFGVGGEHQPLGVGDVHVLGRPAGGGASTSAATAPVSPAFFANRPMRVTRIHRSAQSQVRVDDVADGVEVVGDEDQAEDDDDGHAGQGSAAGRCRRGR